MSTKGFNITVSGVGRTTECLASICYGEAQFGTGDVTILPRGAYVVLSILQHVNKALPGGMLRNARPALTSLMCSANSLQVRAALARSLESRCLNTSPLHSSGSQLQ